MTLSQYRRKRDFTRTREPAPEAAVPRGRRSLFVVQLHHARRRHYDLRLQVGDTLKSWAVPKGPSFDPAVKRLAAEVEDHPVSYADFEGDIPPGEYGAGHVACFDRGVWSSDGDVAAQLRKGHLRFELFGERLKGAWHLVRTARGTGDKPQWLLIKQDDAYAGHIEADDLLDGVTPPRRRTAGAHKSDGTAATRSTKKTTATPRGTAARAAPPRSAPAGPRRRRRRDWQARALRLPGARAGTLADAAFAPQLARLADRPPGGEDWLHELKWDGYRLLAVLHDGKARLWSRNAIEWTQRLPEIVQALQRLGVANAALDGELVAGSGTPADFGRLQSTLAGQAQAPLNYVLFDLLHLDGVDLRASPLRARKELLAALLATPPAHLAYSSHIDGDGAAAFALATARGFEGSVAKRAAAPYHAGRSDNWRKIKQARSEEYAVVGYTAPRGSRSGFGSLLLARFSDGAWRYAGRVGSGFDATQMQAVAAALPRRTRARPSVHIDAIDTDLRTARWFAPAFVVEVFDRGRGRQGLLRQPSLKAVREDKEVAELRAEAAPARAAARAAPAQRSAATDAVRITHADRLVFPADAIRKQDVVDYYRAVAPWLLREIAGRPLSVLRCPDGVGETCFFQKHRTAGLNRVDHVRLTEESGAVRDYLVVNDEQQLIELVQFNALEFHPWGAHAATPDRADRLVFDLDPGPGVAWSEVRRAARDLRARLDEIGLAAFLRTSGGKGLHLVVPLQPGCDWDLAKRFTHAVASSLAQSEPARFVAAASKARRNGRIFIDYLRNTRGATSVASYSLRARAGAPVAMPLDWSELGRLASAAAFDLHSARRRIARRKLDPWDGIETLRQSLERWAG